MEVIDLLNSIGIKYEKIEHMKVFTAKQAEFIKKHIDGTGCKNLFMKNKNGCFYLIIIEDYKRADFKRLKKDMNISHLSFASNTELNEILKLNSGSVSPFGIINDINNRVEIIIDNDLVGKRLLFHPNTNTMTISIDFDDLIKFIEYEKHRYYEIKM